MKIGYEQGKNIKNNVTYFLEGYAKKNPNKSIFCWVNPELFRSPDNIDLNKLESQAINYRNFVEFTSKIASGYSNLGIKKGDRVVIFLPMVLNMYLALSALQRIGAIPVLLDSWTRHIHLKTCIDQVKPSGIISFDKAFLLGRSLPELEAIPLKISVGPTTQKYSAKLEGLIDSSSTIPITPVEQEDTALITFTTGSSGVPKGADRSHRFLAAQHYALNKCIPYQENDIDLPIFPVFSLNNVASGITTVLPAIDISTQKSTDAAILLNQIKNSGVNCATLSPSIFNNLSKYCIENKLEIPQLRRVVTGGAPISRNNVINFKSVAKNAEVIVLYGSTEVEPISQIRDKELLSFKSEQKEDPDIVEEGVNIGHIVPGLKYKFIKIDKNPIKVATSGDWKSIEISSGIGELIVTGEHVCQRYYKNPEAFNRAKIVDTNGTVWHRTGDLVRQDKKGNFWIVGRVHNAIKRFGTYVFPVKAEVVLKKLSFVAQAAYLGMPDPSLGEKSIVVIQTNDGTLLSESDNKRSWELKVRELFTKNNLPVDSILFVDSIPMDPRHHSKVEYSQLRKQIQEEL